MTRPAILASPRGVVARIVPGPHDAHRQNFYLPMRHDAGQPRAVIRWRISQPRNVALDATVATAYGWPADISADDALAELLALNLANGR